jgi:hypothetical protein
MSDEIWVLFFIVYLGVIWLTLNYNLRKIERLLTASRKTKNGKDSSPS